MSSHVPPSPTQDNKIPAQNIFFKMLNKHVTAIIGICLFILIIVIFFEFDSFTAHRRFQETNNAYTHFDTVNIEAKVGGYVRSVNVEDFRNVEDGQVLAVLEDDEYLMQVLACEAQKEEAQASLLSLDREISLEEARLLDAQTAVRSAEARLNLAQKENARHQRLSKEKAVSVKDRENAETNLRTATADYDESLLKVKTRELQIDVLKAERPLREARLKAAEANLGKARINLGHTRITAPVNGQIGACGVRIGELVQPGTHIVNIVPHKRPYVIANFKETQLMRMRAGQKAIVKLDTFPGEEITGYISQIAPATGAAFSVLSVDNASGNFTKVTQRIPVRIDFDEGQELLKKIRAGMSLDVTIDTQSGHKT